MDIVNFFEQIQGRWFSQRTTHFLLNQASKAGQSNLEIQLLEPTSPELAQMCQASAVALTDVLYGLRISQDSLMDGDTSRRKSATNLLALKPNDANTGQLITMAGTPSSAQGQYHFEDDILTLTTEKGDQLTEERIWFVSENLRMRTSLLKTAAGICMTSFCSEIRLGVSKPTPAN